jgi:hypothetical protein
MSIYDKSINELLHNKDSAPGRVRTFLLNPEQGTTPHSCTRYEWNGDLVDLLIFAARALKGGSGVKITFPTNTKLVEPHNLGEWTGDISENHPEFDAIEKYATWLDTQQVKWIRVEDSIEGENGILDTWEKLVNLVSWHGVVIDLSNIRPAGTQNSNGLIASGAESFLTIYIAIAKYLETGTINSLLKLLGTLNSVMRRGGYKKGIITSAMSSECDLIKDYLRVPTIEIEGSHKKGIIVYDSVFEDPELVDMICESRNSESTFFEKPCKPSPIRRTFISDAPLVSLTTPPWSPSISSGLAWNVCNGLILGHKATCLIWRVNLGLCQVSEIVEAFKQAALNICELHTTWRAKMLELAAYYAPLEDDRQVGLDVMGLANLLAIEGVTYLEFADALAWHLLKETTTKPTAKALEIAYQLREGYKAATSVCDSYMLAKDLPQLDRIFTVEPAQSHAYECFDRLGKTTCRGIFAPTGRIVTRVSSSQQNKRYFHGQIETDVMVGVELHERVCDLWQTMMDLTGRSHGISQDSWREMDANLLTDFMARPSQTLYYQEAGNYNQRGFLAKTVQTVETCEINRPGECLACAG